MRNFGERHEMKMLQSAADNLLELMPAFSWKLKYFNHLDLYNY